MHSLCKLALVLTFVPFAGGCGRPVPPPVPVPAVLAPPLTVVTPPAGVTAEDAAKQLLQKKDAAALKMLLAVNAKDDGQILKMGGELDWPAQMEGIGSIDVIRNVQLVTVQGQEYLVAVCTLSLPRPTQFAHIGPAKVGRAYVFTPEGKLVSTFGPRAQECDVMVLNLGTEDMWFVWVKKNINQRDVSESDVYLLNQSNGCALRMQHPVNGVGFTANPEHAKLVPSSIIFTGTDEVNSPGKDGVVRPTRFVTHAIGRDGKEHVRSIEWDSKSQVFRGPGRLKRGQSLVYEVNEKASTKFAATDTGEPGAAAAK